MYSLVVLLWRAALVVAFTLSVSTQSPPDPRKQALRHYQAASKFFVERQFGAAAAELAQSLALNPDQLAATRLLGLCHQLLGDYDAATRAFTKATRLAPNDAEAWFYLGRIYWIQNFFDDARRALETAARLSPSDWRIRECLALTAEAMQEHDLALGEYRQAVTLNEARPGPSHTPALNFGAFLSKIGRHAEGEAQLKRAVELNPADWQPRFELGRLYSRTGDLARAVAALEAAARANAAGEDRVRVYRALVPLYNQLGRREDAARAVAAAGR